jgi:hypothetical protein
MVMVVEEEERLFDYTASPKQHFVLSEFQVAEKPAAMAHQLLSWDGERRNSKSAWRRSSCLGCST